MVCVWFVYGLCMVCVWYVYGSPDPNLTLALTLTLTLTQCEVRRHSARRLLLRDDRQPAGTHGAPMALSLALTLTLPPTLVSILIMALLWPQS